MFMIGFIYDEYCNKPEMAEANYRRVLKNAPGCELADDAEFMMLHLGEQMASVNKLQAEVKRQGKKVEAPETDTAGLKVEMMPVKQKRNSALHFEQPMYAPPVLPAGFLLQLINTIIRRRIGYETEKCSHKKRNIIESGPGVYVEALV